MSRYLDGVVLEMAVQLASNPGRHRDSTGSVQPALVELAACTHMMDMWVAVILPDRMDHIHCRGIESLTGYLYGAVEQVR